MELNRSNSIAGEALRILEQFRAIRRKLNALNSTTPPPFRGLTAESITDALGRFNVWIGNLGVLARGRSALDHRLAHTDVRMEVIRLLRQLWSSLSELWEIVSEAREEGTWFANDAIEAFETFSEDDFSDFEEAVGNNPGTPSTEDRADFPQTPLPELQTESHQLYLMIVETIGSLFRLSMFIRKSTMGNKFAKSSAEKNYETQPDIMHVQATFPFASHNSELIARLGKANAQRRQWLSYKKRHREKLGTGVVEDEPRSLEYVRTAPGSFAQHAESHGSTSVILESVPSTLTVLSSTEASTFYEKSREYRENEGMSEGAFSETTYNESQRSDSDQGPTYAPQPPRGSEDETPFECPYCFTILTIANRNEWTRHVHSDLASYVCTQDNCSHPLFESRHQWFNHELEVHRLEWVCNSCPATHSSIKDLRLHIEQQHVALFKNSQLDILVAQGGRTVKRIPASSCPLCDYDTILRNKASQSGRGFPQSEPILLRPQAFRAHLGRHLEQLALFVLPKTELMELAEPAVQSVAAQDGDVVIVDKTNPSDESEEDDVHDNITPESEEMDIPHELHLSQPEADDFYEELTEAPELAMGWLPPMNFTPPESDFTVEDSDWAPRREDSMFGGDLFTPGWVRGYGKEKEGFCGRCEPGVWHNMDDQSYENNLTYCHGIDSTGVPLPRPSSIRPVHGKEKLWEGYCEDCKGWRTLRTTKMGWNWFRHCVKEHKHHEVEKTALEPAMGAIDVLIASIKMGNLKEVTSIIEGQRLLLDGRVSNARSPLHYAAEAGNLEVLVYIINKYASMKKQREVEQWLDSTSSEGETALMLAASQGHHEAIVLLIGKGVNLDITNKNGHTALDQAAESGYQWIVETLMRNNASTEISKVYRQIRLRKKRTLDQEAAERLQEAKPSEEVTSSKEVAQTPLITAALNGDLAATKTLLARGVDIEEASRDGDTALMLAASKKERDVLKILLDSGANVNATSAKGWTALMLAVQNNDEGTVKLLLQFGADVNHVSPDRWTALAEATLQSQISMLSLLLENGADTESKSSHDWTPLMHAAYKGDVKAVRLLLDAGAELDVTSLHDETAILLAAAGAHVGIAHMLLDAGCAPEPAWAVANQSAEGQSDVKKKAQDRATLGWTPLMLACQNGLEELVMMLLGRNVNLEPQSPYRKTALVIAKENVKMEIVELLLDHAAREVIREESKR